MLTWIGQVHSRMNSSKGYGVHLTLESRYLGHCHCLTNWRRLRPREGWIPPNLFMCSRLLENVLPHIARQEPPWKFKTSRQASQPPSPPKESWLWCDPSCLPSQRRVRSASNPQEADLLRPTIERSAKPHGNNIWHPVLDRVTVGRSHPPIGHRCGGLSAQRKGETVESRSLCVVLLGCPHA